MITALVLALPAALCTTEGPPLPPALQSAASPSVIAADSLEFVFANGRRWPEFHAAVDRRRAVWDRNWTNAKIPDSLAARARSTGRLRILVITEPGCSDSANSIPWLARLVAAGSQGWLLAVRREDVVVCNGRGARDSARTGGDAGGRAHRHTHLSLAHTLTYHRS